MKYVASATPSLRFALAAAARSDASPEAALGEDALEPRALGKELEVPTHPDAHSASRLIGKTSLARITALP
ncbi:MAG TPA: hypothetical protein VFZ53_03915 [Polyangiaceae bacterium]